MYRYSNGRFKSKRRHELEQKMKKDMLRGMLFMTISLLTIGLMFGFALQPYSITLNKTEAHEFVYKPDLCSLAVIECEDEEPIQESKVEKAIREIPHESPETERRIRYLYENAGENADMMAHTIYCESLWNSVKSYLPEESYGIAQIHLPSHNVTKEQALNAYFSIDFMIKNWDDDIWFAFDRITDRCTNGLPEYWK